MTKFHATPMILCNIEMVLLRIQQVITIDRLGTETMLLIISSLSTTDGFILSPGMHYILQMKVVGVTAITSESSCRYKNT